MTPLTEAQKKMLIASEPDDRTGEEGCGIELRTGADHTVARSLERRGLGEYKGADSLPGMYWSNEEGLSERRTLLGLPEEDEDEDGLLFME